MHKNISFLSVVIYIKKLYFFKKSIDKNNTLCYNINVRLRKRTAEAAAKTTKQKINFIKRKDFEK